MDLAESPYYIHYLSSGKLFNFLIAQFIHLYRAGSNTWPAETREESAESQLMGGAQETEITKIKV